MSSTLLSASTTQRITAALLCPYPHDGGIKGGPWAVGYNLAAGLAGCESLQPHVIYYSSDLSMPSVRRDHHGRVQIHAVPVKQQRPWPTLLRSIQQIAAETRTLQPAVANSHTPEYGVAALRAGAPTIYTVHGVVRRELRTFRDWRHRLALAVLVLLDAYVARRVREIVAISPYVIREYQGRTRARFTRIEVPIGDVFFAVKGEERPSSLLLVGGMTERKDPLTLLAALSVVREAVPAVELRVAGRMGDSPYQQRLRREIRDRKLETCVTFLGSLDQPALAEAYARCAVLVLSSRQETAPAVLMEAMAAGRPTVASDVGGVRDIVVHGETGFVIPPADPAALAQAIVQLLNDASLRRRMGEKGRELAARRYRRDVVAAQYAAL